MKRSMIGVLALALLSMAAVAQAGSPRISLSIGAVGCYPYCHPWGPRPYVYAPPMVYYPAPVVQPVIPAYTVPAYSAAPAPAPSWTNRAEPRSNILPASQGITSTVTLRNPAGSGGAVTFVVDDATEVTLHAGQTQTLSSGASYLIEFDRGADYGVTRKSLGSGAYEFQVTDRGWDLVDAGRVASKPALRRNELPATQLR